MCLEKLHMAGGRDLQEEPGARENNEQENSFQQQGKIKEPLCFKDGCI